MTELLFSYGTLRQREVFEVTTADLGAADDYEVHDYRRVQVPLRSGEQEWVYVFSG
ncbi:hypothetical protein BH11ACT6_BH11ACT6_02930 [soil metagenome]